MQFFNLVFFYELKAILLFLMLLDLYTSSAKSTIGNVSFITYIRQLVSGRFISYISCFFKKEKRGDYNGNRRE